MLLPINLNFQHALSAEQLNSVNSAAAHAVASLVRSHLHNLPGKSFYKQAADSVSVTSHLNSYSVTISQPGIALQFFGGTVRPSGRISSVTGRPTRALLIPLLPKSQLQQHSSSPFVITSRSGALLLVSKNTPEQSLTPLALLRKSATIKPHPHILPSHELIISTASKAASVKIAKLLTFQSSNS